AEAMYMQEYAMIALQYFLGNQAETSLYSLLHWICSYQTLFSRSCRKCSKLLAMDKQSNLLLPPVHLPYWKFSFSKVLSTVSSKDQNSDDTVKSPTSVERWPD
ncbi:mediator of RNA polymerase II transcription subunit 27-like protein, partial [Trifolium pratense]